MRLLFLALMLVVLAGCGPVSLLTDTQHDKTWCYTTGTTGVLIVDSTYGTRLAGGSSPVMWPRGFTGRWLGSEIEVLDPTGNVVAITGKKYSLPGGLFEPDPPLPGVSSVWLSCGDPHPVGP